MRLHLLGIPHTVTHRDWSHCAFTQKVRRFAPMMRPYGWEVIHYGVEGSESGATEDVILMDQDEHQDLLGHPYDHTALYGADAVDGSNVYRQWNMYARNELMDRVEPGDLILLPFGHAHSAAIRSLRVLTQGAGAIESGIGYYDTMLPWRIWESYAVRHGAMGREGRHGVSLDSSRLEFVVPNYYDLDEWPAVYGDRFDAPVVFLGRLTEGKGVHIVLEVAKARPDVRFQIAGQGDLAAFGDLPPNVEYLGVLGAERAAVLGAARAIIAPSRYVEPFCGAVVEAQLCGTPAITSDFGAFAETVQHGITGFRCPTEKAFIRAVDRVLGLNRRTIRKRAERLWALPRVGRLYHEAFEIVQERLASHGFPTGW
jgi:glycosyltransferase involved in cell wall biosynthesis